MKNLLKFEYHKLFKQKSFYICLIVMIAFSFLGLLLSQEILKTQTEIVVNISAKSILIKSISNSNFAMISGIFLAIFVCDDYTNSTIKNIYSRGFSRTKVYLAKYIVSISAVTIMFIFTLGFNYIAGLSMFDGLAENGNYFGLILGQFAFVFSFGSFVFMICNILRKVGSSIAFAIIGPSLITTILSLIDAFLNIDSFSLSSYWIDSFLTDLTSISISTTRLVTCIVFSIIYIILFTIIGLKFSKKQEN